MMKNDVLSNNAFVKAEQEKQRRMMGDRPPQRAEAYKFDAYMCNNGESAQDYGKKLTKGIDDAFPVKQSIERVQVFIPFPAPFHFLDETTTRAYG